jgi:CelD/BcsL family acetyltransferase involved in cellulose biosynthesis
VGDRPAASAVFLAHGDTVIYKYGASDPMLRHTRANHLLFDRAIEHACSQGFRTFDFGRTDLADESLRAFKARWGAEETVEGCSVLGQGSDGGTAQVPSFARTVLRIAPPQLARWTGEALYRWTA